MLERNADTGKLGNDLEKYVATISRFEEKSKQHKCTILDSGERREFETGAKRDMQTGKGRFDLMPWTALMEIAKHCENGALKYGEHNVDKGIPLHSFVDSAFRHLAKYNEGWEDEPHLIAAAWNLLWAIQTEIRHPWLKDVPWRDEKTKFEPECWGAREDKHLTDIHKGKEGEPGMR